MSCRIGVCAVLGCVLCVVGGGTAHAQGYSVVGGGSGRAGAATGTAGDANATAGGAGAATPGGTGTGAGAGVASGGAAGGGTAVIRRRGGGDEGGVALGSPRHPWDYGGVVPPGNGVVPPGFSQRAVRRAGGRALVAWPGFQMTEGGSRIFLAVSRTPQMSLSRAAGRLVYRLSNAMVPVRNNRRALETEAFETPVSRAYLRQRGRDVELIIELRGAAEPQVTQQAGSSGLGFVYLDFARWSPAASEQGAGAGARTGGGSTGTSRQGPVVDPERPPPVRR